MTKNMMFMALLVPLTGSGAEILRDGSDFITYDPETKTYAVSYRCSDDNQDHVVSIKPSTDFAVNVEVDFERSGRGSVEYAYFVQNAHASRQAVQFLWVPVSGKDDTATWPRGWEANVTTQDNGYELGWYTDDHKALRPGHLQKFALVTQSLPTVGTIALMGPAELLAFCGEGPNPTVSTYMEDNLLSVKKNRVVVETIVPGIKINSAMPELMLDMLALEIGKMSSRAGRADLADELVTDVTNAAASCRGQDMRSALESLRLARELLRRRDGENGQEWAGREKNLFALRALEFDIDFVADVLRRSTNRRPEEDAHHHR